MWQNAEDTAEDGFLLSLTFSLGSLGDGSYRFRSSPGAEDCDDPGLDPDEVRLYLVILWGPVRHRDRESERFERSIDHSTRRPSWQGVNTMAMGNRSGHGWKQLYSR